MREDEEIIIDGISYHAIRVNGETVSMIPNRFDNGIEMLASTPEQRAITNPASKSSGGPTWGNLSTQ